MVSYVIEIHKDGGRRGITTHAGPLEKAKVEAGEALRQHRAEFRAEFVLVIDLDNFVEVYSVHRDASGQHVLLPEEDLGRGEIFSLKKQPSSDDNDR